MLDIGWSELLIIGVVALIVVGPRDLPQMFRALGRITAKARGMAREFSTAMEEAARDTGIDEAAKSLNDIKGLTSKRAMGVDALDRAAERFEKWEPKLSPSRGGATPDPDAPAVKADRNTPAASAEAPAAPAPSAPTPAPAADTDPHAPSPGQRRLHAVRRGDTKDA